MVAQKEVARQLQKPRLVQAEHQTSLQARQKHAHLQKQLTVHQDKLLQKQAQTKSLQQRTH